MKVLAKSGALGLDLANAFDASPNPYMLLTPDLRFAGMNRAYLEVTRSQREALLGRHIFEVFDAGGDANNVKLLRESLERVLATGLTDHIALLHYAIPLPDETGAVRNTDRYWSCTHSPVTDDKGVLRYVLQHATDITELHALRALAADATREESALDLIAGGRLIQTAEHVQASNERLKTERNHLIDMFMQTPGFVCVLSGPDHVFQMHNGAYDQLIGHRDIAGKPIREALPEVVGQGYLRFLDGVYATGEPHQGRNSKVMLQREPGGPLEAVYLDFIYQPIRNGSGTVAGIFVQGYEVTETVMATERQKLMIDELNHRVKNTLATVQSIAVQTARSHPDPRTFAESFQARLLALSHTHDLLTRSHWEGADLGAILAHETAAHGTHRITPVGPPLALGPAAALSFGMIFHELATNAAKYGALSAAEGRVLVDWAVADHAKPVLTLTWREVGGPPATEPTRKGFGSRLIERNVRHDLAGEVKFDYVSDGFRAEISVPLDRERIS